MSKQTVYTLGFCFTPSMDEVLLIKKNAPKSQAGLLNGLGGHVEENEGNRYAESMAREFREESGLETGWWIKFAIMHGSMFYIPCFVSHMRREQLLNAYATTEEGSIRLVTVSTLNHYECMPNLLWLLAMAQAHIRAPRDQSILEVKYP